MVTLPGEDSIAPLPDHLPRRMGVGAWQPGVIRQDTEQLGQGLEALGRGGMQYAGAEQRSQDQSDLANANMAYHVGATQLAQQAEQTNDPDQLAAINHQYDLLYGQSGDIAGPRMGAQFEQQNADVLARSQAGISNKIYGINKSQDLANYQQNRDTLIGGIVGETDPNKVNPVIDTIGQNISALAAKGYLTPEQEKTERLAVPGSLAVARNDYFKQQILAAPPGTPQYDTAVANYKNFLGQGAFASPAATAQPVQQATGALTSSGYTPEQASGIVGNLIYEGGGSLNPNARNKGDGADGSDSIGIGQWNGQRAQQLMAFAAARNKPWNDLPTQIAFMQHELQTTESDADAAIRAAKTPQQAAEAMLQYERPKGFEGGLATAAGGAQRLQNAQSVYAGLNTAPQQSAFIGLPPPAAPIPEPPKDQWPAGAAYVARSAAGAPMFIGHDGQPLPDAQQPQASVAAGRQGSAPNLTLVPSKDKWPDGATAVNPNADGSLSYQMSDGTTQPVPGSTAHGAPALPLPQRPSGSTLDFLPPQKHAQMLLEGQSFLDEAQRRADAAQDLATRQGVAALKGVNSALISGQQVPDTSFEPYRQQFSDPSNPALSQAFAKTDSIRNTINSYRGQDPAYVAADVDKQWAQYNQAVAANPNDKLNPIRLATVNAASQYLKTYQTMTTKDPLTWASKTGLVPDGAIKPINWNDPNVAQELADRKVVAEQVADKLGQNDVTYLTPEERLSARQVGQTGGAPLVNLAANAIQGLQDGSGRFFKEIGGTAPEFATIGMMKLNGADPAAIEDYSKYLAAQHDPMAKKGLPEITPGLINRTAEEPLNTATAGFGNDYTASIKQARNALLTMDALRNGVAPADAVAQPLVDKATNRALGATYDADGVQYGGLAKIGGAGWNPLTWNSSPSTILVPQDMLADKFQEVLSKITDDDLSSMRNAPTGTGTAAGTISAPTPGAEGGAMPIVLGGRTMTAAQLRDSQLTALPEKDGTFNGRYAVSYHGAPVLDQNGRNWALDLNALQPTLAKRIPEAYRDTAGMPSLFSPEAANPYARVRGMTMGEAPNTAPSDNSNLIAAAAASTEEE